jgi:ribonuclease P protein component
MIDQLFSEGTSEVAYPVRLLFLKSPEQVAGLKAGFTVSNKNFKKATDRNRIKRLLRESYRQQKNVLADHAAQRGFYVSLFFIYSGKEMPDLPAVYDKIGALLKAVIKEIK